MNTFKINGKTYIAKPFDFDMVCNLEDLGVSVDTMFDKPSCLMRAYLSICGNMSLEQSAKEINQHIIGKGKLDSINKAIGKEIEESDFFRSLTETEEKDAQTEEEEVVPIQKKTRAKKTVE